MLHLNSFEGVVAGTACKRTLAVRGATQGQLVVWRSQTPSSYSHRRIDAGTSQPINQLDAQWSDSSYLLFYWFHREEPEMEVPVEPVLADSWDESSIPWSPSPWSPWRYHELWRS